MKAPESSLVGKGVYTFGDAARYTRLRRPRIREWFRIRGDDALFRSAFDGLTEETLVSFEDLIEVFIAGQLRDHGVPLQTIRRVHRALREKWGDPRPFCRPELRSSGKKVFYVGLDEHGREQIHDVLTGQNVFPDVISPFLRRLDYDRRSVSRWRIASGVEIDPGFSFGKPVASISKVPTYLLSSSFLANGKQLDAVARWYGVTTDDVKAAVDFESSLAA